VTRAKAIQEPVVEPTIHEKDQLDKLPEEVPCKAKRKTFGAEEELAQAGTGKKAKTYVDIVCA